VLVPLRGAPREDQRRRPGLWIGHGRLDGVEVLEAKRVGSFAAFVLRATDGAAMKAWLDRNKFVTTPASEAWLQHYVKRKFFFVALRFEPSLFAEKPGRSKPGARAETLRITFETPVPFYPYLEPDRDDLTGDRVLALWLVTPGKRKVPVALARDGGKLSYQRPWREGQRHSPAKAESLAPAVGEKAWKTFAPKGDGPFTIQVFEDQKRVRRGFGDVLLVPEEPEELDAGAIEKRRALLPILDPTLEAP
jgi:hypothetical protein